MIKQIEIIILFILLLLNITHSIPSVSPVEMYDYKGEVVFFYYN